MFIKKDFILATELTNKMGIHIANMSMIYNKMESSGNTGDFLKLGISTFINTKSVDLPKNIREGIAKHTFTDMTNLLPTQFVQKEFGIRKTEIYKLTENQHYPEFEKIVQVEDKEFVQFSKEFIEKTKNCVVYPLSYKETLECKEDGDIDGFLILNKTRCLTWYNIEPSSVRSPEGF